MPESALKELDLVLLFSISDRKGFFLSSEEEAQGLHLGVFFFFLGGGFLGGSGGGGGGVFVLGGRGCVFWGGGGGGGLLGVGLFPGWNQSSRGHP